MLSCQQVSSALASSSPTLSGSVDEDSWGQLKICPPFEHRHRRRPISMLVAASRGDSLGFSPRLSLSTSTPLRCPRRLAAGGRMNARSASQRKDAILLLRGVIGVLSMEPLAEPRRGSASGTRFVSECRAALAAVLETVEPVRCAPALRSLNRSG